MQDAFLFVDPAKIVSDFHFYSGLVAIEEGDANLAAEHLAEACEGNTVEHNPDIVIAMHKIADTPKFTDYFEKQRD